MYKVLLPVMLKINKLSYDDIRLCTAKNYDLHNVPISLYYIYCAFCSISKDVNCKQLKCSFYYDIVFHLLID